MTRRPTHAYRVVLASLATTGEAQAALRQAMLDHLEPRVSRSGTGSAITVTTLAGSQREAESYAASTVGSALGEVVRPIMTVALS